MALVFTVGFLIANIDMDAFLEKFMQIPVQVLSVEAKTFVRNLLKRFSGIMVRYFGRQMLVCMTAFIKSVWLVVVQRIGTKTDFQKHDAMKFKIGSTIRQIRGRKRAVEDTSEFI